MCTGETGSPVHMSEEEWQLGSVFRHFNGVMLVAFDKGRCFPCAVGDASALVLEGERHVA